MFDLVYIPAALGLGALFTALIVRRYPERFVRPNFQQRQIPSACGLAFVIASIVYYGGSAAAGNAQHAAIEWLFVIAAAGFGLLGLLDDLKGDRSVGWLKGHLRALASGRVTTGAIKAIGGVLLALACGWIIHPADWRALLAALIIAGTANSLNLVDLRPGRCLTLFFAASIPLIPIITTMAMRGAGVSTLPIAFALIGAALLLIWERKALFMLGDTGSNAFGAVLGLSYAIYLPDIRAQAVIAALIVLLHIWTEGHSISRWIDSKPLLRRLDSKIGVR